MNEKTKPIGIKAVDPTWHLIPLSQVPADEIWKETTIKNKLKSIAKNPKTITIHLFLMTSDSFLNKIKNKIILGKNNTIRGIIKIFIDSS